MPAFSFEKIAPPAQLETTGPASPPARRGVIVRVLDRLTSVRLQKSEGEIRKDQKPQRKDRKPR